MTYHTPDRYLSSHFSLSRLILSIGSLFLVCLLAACGSGGSSTGTTSASPSASTPAPTRQATSAPTQLSSTTSLTTYSGDGFRISYPQGWTVVKGSNGSVVFVDEHAGATKGSHVAITLGKQGLVHPTSTILNFWQRAFVA